MIKGFWSEEVNALGPVHEKVMAAGALANRLRVWVVQTVPPVTDKKGVALTVTFIEAGALQELAAVTIRLYVPLLFTTEETICGF